MHVLNLSRHYLKTVTKVNSCNTGSLTQIFSFDTCYVFGQTP
jgi:hypothetical protein